MKTTRFYAALLLWLMPTQAYQALESLERRAAFSRLLAGAAAFVVATPAHAVLRSKGCYQGEGEACAEYSADNDLIRSLQEKSAANREKNEKVRILFIREWSAAST